MTQPAERRRGHLRAGSALADRALMDPHDKLVESVELLAELLPAGSHFAVIDGRQAPLVQVREALSHGSAVEIIQQQRRWIGTYETQVAAIGAHAAPEAVQEFEVRLRMHVQAVNSLRYSWGW